MESTSFVVPTLAETPVKPTDGHVCVWSLRVKEAAPEVGFSSKFDKLPAEGVPNALFDSPPV